MASLFRRFVRLNTSSEQFVGHGASFKTPAFRIAFDVLFKSSSRPNKAKIKIWNLNEQSIEILARPFSVATLIAGYKGRAGNPGYKSKIIGGEIVILDTVHAGLDNVTTIEVKDSGLLYRNARYDRSFAGPISNNLVFRDIITQFNLGTGFGTTLIPEIVYPEGIAFCGPLRTALDELIVEDLDGEWSIVDGDLQILLGDDVPTNQGDFVLSDKTGLIRAKKKKRGVELTCLMLPDMRPGRFLKVEGRDIKGFFVARTVQFVGDGYEAGQVFQTIIKARTLEGAEVVARIG